MASGALTTGVEQRLPLIGRKITVPAAAGHVLRRPRLETLLARLIDANRVIVLAATAGAGKSTAVAAAAAQIDRQVAWLSVDRTDVAPGRLLTYIEAALASAVPHVQGLASRALAAGIPHAEAAGLLADAIGDVPVLFALDDLERLEQSPEAWEVIEALLRYAPPTTAVVLLSRREIPTAVCALPPQHELAVLGEQHLAFTEDEAEAALAGLGRPDADPAAVVGATGGWVTGVLFEAWRASEHVAGVGGEADPLNGYLSSHILGSLAEDDREFLISVSALDEVTAERAGALGLARAGEHLLALHNAHLPVTWSPDGLVMRCHSRFREYLLQRLSRRGEDALRELRTAHGRLLAREANDEDAVEELLRAGAIEEALPIAERAIVRVIERLDVSIAERWLEVFGDVASSGASGMTTAELMLAIGRDDLRQAVRIADQLEAIGQRSALAAESPMAALFMSWAYTHVGRHDDIVAILDAVEPGPLVRAVRYASVMMTEVPDPDAELAPPLTGGPHDALTSIAHYGRGQLSELVDAGQSPWVSAVVAPFRVAALRALGQTDEALALFEAASGRVGTWRLWVGPELLMDAGRPEEARQLITDGQVWADGSGSLGFHAFNRISAVKLALRFDHDTAAARAILERLEQQDRLRDLRIVGEMLDCWYGLALLLDNEDAAALARLKAAVAGMARGERLLELPPAAVFLAEACWRAGDEEGADAAADLALRTSQRVGSNHLLLQALADVPGVISRRLDAEPAADSPWHEIGRALIAQGLSLHADLRPTVHLYEFGRRAIAIGSEEVRPRLAKSYELLAFLIVAGPRTVTRVELLDALFDGKTDDSTRSHLRQAVQWLRKSLPGDEALISDANGWRLADSITVASDSARLESQLAQAARQQGEERLRATLKAVAIFDRGPYLPGPRSPWADQRAATLTALVVTARQEAAEIAYALGRWDVAQELAEAVLTSDPYREVAWRLQMRIASALGDDDRVIRVFQECERALGQLGAAASRTTRNLLGELRR